MENQLGCLPVKVAKEAMPPAVAHHLCCSTVTCSPTVDDMNEMNAAECTAGLFWRCGFLY